MVDKAHQPEMFGNWDEFTRGNNGPVRFTHSQQRFIIYRFSQTRAVNGLQCEDHPPLIQRPDDPVCHNDILSPLRVACFAWLIDADRIAGRCLGPFKCLKGTRQDKRHGVGLFGDENASLANTCCKRAGRTLNH